MKKILFILTIYFSIPFSNLISAEYGEYYGDYTIIDLMVMDEKEYDSNRDQSIVGYIVPEIFKTKSECEQKLIGDAGTIWEIERTKNPHRGGELRLHQYEEKYNPYTQKYEKKIYMVRFCLDLIRPIK